MRIAFAAMEEHTVSRVGQALAHDAPFYAPLRHAVGHDLGRYFSSVSKRVGFCFANSNSAGEKSSSRTSRQASLLGSAVNRQFRRIRGFSPGAQLSLVIVL